MRPMPARRATPSPPAPLPTHPPVPLLLEQTDEWGKVLAEERTVTEDVGPLGFCVRARRPFRCGTILTVREPNGAFEGTAQVVHSVAGPDGLRRLEMVLLGGDGLSHLLR